MTNKPEVYKNLKAVHEAFQSWESDNKALKFAWNLWKVTEKEVLEEFGENIDKERCANEVYNKLYYSGSLTTCLTDNLRRLIIRYHARGVTTTVGVESIIMDDNYEDITPFYLFRHSNVCGEMKIKNFLVGRLSYLKPSHPRWPDKKYGKFWAEERSKYVDKIKQIPLTQPEEQLQKLSEHYGDLEQQYQSATSASDKERYHKCMMRTLAGIYQFTRDPAYDSVLPKTLTQENRPAALPNPTQQTQQENVIDISISKE